MDTKDPQGNPLAVEPQDEQLPVALITAVSVVGLLVFAAGVFWAVQIQNSVEAGVEDEFGPHRIPELVGRAEIGIVDQRLFELEQRASQMQEAKAEHLQSAGWVSKRQQIIHIPITAAMRAVAEGKVVRQPFPEGARPQEGPIGEPGTPLPPQVPPQGSINPVAPPTQPVVPTQPNTLPQ